MQTYSLIQEVSLYISIWPKSGNWMHQISVASCCGIVLSEAENCDNSQFYAKLQEFIFGLPNACIC